MTRLGGGEGEAHQGQGGRCSSGKVSESYLQGEDGASDKERFLKEMKDSHLPAKSRKPSKKN